MESGTRMWVFAGEGASGSPDLGVWIHKSDGHGNDIQLNNLAARDLLTSPSKSSPKRSKSLWLLSIAGKAQILGILQS